MAPLSRLPCLPCHPVWPAASGVLRGGAETHVLYLLGFRKQEEMQMASSRVSSVTSQPEQ